MRIKMLKRILNKLKREFKNLMFRIIDLKDARRKKYINFEIESFLDLDDFKIKNEVLKKECLYYNNHFFDVIGSGLTRVEYKGRINKNNILFLLKKRYRRYSKYILEDIDEKYKFINWQKEFKVNFDFNINEWSKNIKFGEVGVDVKVPWELSRMQHLLKMAIVAINYKDVEEDFIIEFKNQVLDFISMNPLYRGVNWNCTMEVAIRSVNLLLSYDIFSQLDKKNILNKNFKNIFINSILDHGNFIINNLEWDNGNRANHYLANIGGLLFISAYFKNHKKGDKWLDFSMKQIKNELNYQFFNDGSNFENSTNYHVLSGEIIVYSTAIILALIRNNKLIDKNYFDKDYIQKIYNIGNFIDRISKNDGTIPQIGDNDSGSFVTITPIGKEVTLNFLRENYSNLKNYNGIEGINLYFDRNTLDKRYFVNMVNLFFSNNNIDFSFFEVRLIKSLIKDIKFDSFTPKNRNTIFLNQNINLKKEFKYKKEFIYDLKRNGISKLNIDSLEKVFFNDFGLGVLKNKEIYLSFYIGSNKLLGTGGHSHNDKLSIELQVLNKNVFLDPGTGVYTSNSKIRNMFRSINAHNCPLILNEEQDKFENLFLIKKQTNSQLLKFEKNYIVMYLKYRNIEVIREIKLYKDKIIIVDKSNFLIKQNFNIKIYSNGYGKYNI